MVATCGFYGASDTVHAPFNFARPLEQYVRVGTETEARSINGKNASRTSSLSGTPNQA